MQEELDDALMHVKGFGEGQCFTHQTPEALAQGVVETLDGVGWTSGLWNTRTGVGLLGARCDSFPNDRCTSGLDGKRAEYEPKGAGRWHRCADPGRRRRSGGYVGTKPAIARSRPAGDGLRRSTTRPVPGHHPVGRPPQ